MEFAAWGVAGASIIAGLVFYFRMRRVGRMLGSSYATSMNTALMLLVIIPFFLELAASNIEGKMGFFVAIMSSVSSMAGLLMIPGILIGALSRTDFSHAEPYETGSRPSFEEKVAAIAAKQRARREDPLTRPNSQGRSDAP